jgi:hypothetical protein
MARDQAEAVDHREVSIQRGTQQIGVVPQGFGELGLDEEKDAFDGRRDGEREIKETEHFIPP